MGIALRHAVAAAAAEPETTRLIAMREEDLHEWSWGSFLKFRNLHEWLSQSASRKNERPQGVRFINNSDCILDRGAQYKVYELTHTSVRLTGHR